VHISNFGQRYGELAGGGMTFINREMKGRANGQKSCSNLVGHAIDSRYDESQRFTRTGPMRSTLT
jgi:hypothetical protein